MVAERSETRHKVSTDVRAEHAEPTARGMCPVHARARSRAVATCSVLLLALVVSISWASAKVADAHNAIEEDVTHHLAEDLIESLEKKYNFDLQSSVDSVLAKIRSLLQNGTAHVRERYALLHSKLMHAKDNDKEGKLEECILSYYNESTALAEKALHQMVLCGYALIGHDPAKALAKVMEIKDEIRTNINPIKENQIELLKLLKLCGHEHGTLKKVLACVVSKSPFIKSTLMVLSSKVVEGVVDLTKLVAHGAMHEACLIEVVRSVEDDASEIVGKIMQCSNPVGKSALTYIDDGNATVIDSNKPASVVTECKNPDDKDCHKEGNKSVKKVEKVIRRFLKKNQGTLDKDLSKKLSELTNYLETGISTVSFMNDTVSDIKKTVK